MCGNFVLGFIQFIQYFNKYNICKIHITHSKYFIRVIFLISFNLKIVIFLKKIFFSKNVYIIKMRIICENIFFFFNLANKVDNIISYGLYLE